MRECSRAWCRRSALLWYLGGDLPDTGGISVFRSPVRSSPTRFRSGSAGLIYTMQNDVHNYFVSNAFGAAAFAIYSVGVAQLPLIGMMRESINAVLLGRVSYSSKRAGGKRSCGYPFR